MKREAEQVLCRFHLTTLARHHSEPLYQWIVDVARREGLQGATDKRVWQAAEEEERFLVTADKGFANALVHPPGTHSGILLLRPEDDGIQPLIRLIQLVLETGGVTRLHGTVAVATPRGVRVRKP
jgi:predicted nuclease of predicted toxin-antitoxin system